MLFKLFKRKKMLLADGVMFLERYQESADYDKAAIQNYWCTEYCQQRGSEAVGEKIKVATDRAAGGYHNAGAWFQYSNYPTSDEPKPGSIACWGGGEYGHVQFVESCSKNDNGTWHISVTQANSEKTFFTGEYDVKVGDFVNGIGTLQGYMILPINDLRVERDTTKQQVLIKASLLRVRTTPNGPWTAGLACPLGIYNCEIIEQEGVKWAKLAENSYVMTNDEEGWSEIYEPEVQPTGDILETLELLTVQIKELLDKNTKLQEELNKYKDLQTKYNTLADENKNLTAELNTANSYITELKDKLVKINELSK